MGTSWVWLSTSKHRRRGTPWLIGLFLALAAPFASACECLWQGPFSEVRGNADLVVYGQVSQRSGNSVDLTVGEILRGKEYRDSIRIWGKTGDLCRPDVERFPVGSEWIMALSRIDEVPEGGFNPFQANVSFGRVADYSLNSCGVYWLPVKSQRVSGNILDGARWQYLDPKKAPVIASLFKQWFDGQIDDQTLAKATNHPTRDKARELLNNTRIFLNHGDEAADELQ